CSADLLLRPMSGGARGLGAGGSGSDGLGLTLRSPHGSARAPTPEPRVPIWLQVLPHSLPPAFAAEPGLAVAAEPRRCVEQIGAVDPHHARFDLGRHVEREIPLLGPHAG